MAQNFVSLGLRLFEQHFVIIRTLYDRHRYADRDRPHDGGPIATALHAESAYLRPISRKLRSEPSHTHPASTAAVTAAAKNIITFFIFFSPFIF